MLFMGLAHRFFERDQFRQVIGQLQFQHAIEVVLRRRGAKPLLQLLHPSQQFFVFQTRQPTWCRGNGTSGLERKFEIGGDVRNLDFAELL